MEIRENICHDSTASLLVVGVQAPQVYYRLRSQTCNIQDISTTQAIRDCLNGQLPDCFTEAENKELMIDLCEHLFAQTFWKFYFILFSLFFIIQL